MIFNPPLRTTVQCLVGMKNGMVSYRTIAEIAQVTDSRAKAYLSILLANRVVEDRSHGVIAGPKWNEWSARPMKTRPRIQYKSDNDIYRIRITLADRIIKEVNKRKLSMYKFSQEIGIPYNYFVKIVKRGKLPPVWYMLVIARGLGLSIEELAGVN